MIRGKSNPEPVLYKGEEWVVVGCFGSFFIIKNLKTGQCTSANTKKLDFLSDKSVKERGSV